MTKKQLFSKRNERLTIAVAFLGNLAFILPVWLLFGTNELGLSTTLTTALFMTLWIGSGLLEIPTGALADRFGRKRMFLIGVSLLSLYPLAYALELPVYAILMMTALAAFGSALQSGTLLALTHVSFQHEGRSEKEYHALLSKDKIYSFIARAISGVMGGVLYVIDPRLPFIAVFMVFIAMFFVGLFIVDQATERSQLTNRMHVIAALKAVKSRPVVRTTIIMYASIKLASEAMWTGFQPLFESDGISPGYIGLIFSCIAVFSAIGAYIVRRLMMHVGVLRIEIIVSALATAGALMLFLPHTLWHLFSIVPVAFAFGLALTPVQATAQKYTSEKLHSTVLSTISVVQYTVYGIASISVGVMLDVFGTDTTRKILFIEALIILTGLLALYAARRDRDEIITQK